VLRCVELHSNGKRLQFRCWHRGPREAALLLGRCAQAYLAELDAYCGEAAGPFPAARLAAAGPGEPEEEVVSVGPAASGTFSPFCAS